jgi:hypothetical protein
LFGAAKKKQDKEERHHDQRKKDRAAVPVNRGMNHFGTDVNAQLADHENAESVSQQPEWKHGQRQDSPLPRRSQEEVTRDQTGQEQHQAGMDAAAFWRDLQRKARQLKIQVMVKDRRSG